MRAVVTGAGGFLGGRLAHQLKDAGHDVVGFQRGSYPALEAAGIQCIRGDLTNKEDVEGAIKGADAVFHVAAKVDFLGPAEIFERINIGGTDHVIDACKKHNVERLVYCSTPSVTLSGTHDVNVDESAPYAATYPAHYPRTKAEAERHALAANGTSLDGGGQLRTCALRPHFVFGPGDQNILPRVVERLRAGRFRIIGDGNNEIDWCYLDNASQAHMLAEEALRDPRAPAAGKPFFITNGAPVNPWEWLNEIFEGAGLPKVTKRVPLGLARVVGRTLEGAWSMLGKEGEPPITEYAAVSLATTHTYDLTAARRDLAYNPQVSVEEGTRRIIAWLKDELEAGRI